MKRNNFFRGLTIVLALAFAVRLSVGLTMNEIRDNNERQYQEAIELLNNNGVLAFTIDNSVSYSTPWETEKETIEALYVISQRHQLMLFTH